MYWKPFVVQISIIAIGVLAIFVLVLFVVSTAKAQGIQNFTTVDPTTGQVSTGTVTTTPNGGQSYMWNSPTGQTSTGYVSPPIGGTSNYSTYSGQTGQVGVGSIHTTPPNNAPVFLPTPPSPPARR